MKANNKEGRTKLSNAEEFANRVKFNENFASHPFFNTAADLDPPPTSGGKTFVYPAELAQNIPQDRIRRVETIDGTTLSHSIKGGRNLLILDVRKFSSFLSSRIAGAFNFQIPSRLLADERYTIKEIIQYKAPEATRFSLDDWAKERDIVVYGDEPNSISALYYTLMKFYDAGWNGNGHILEGGFDTFAREFPGAIDGLPPPGYVALTFSAKSPGPGQKAAPVTKFPQEATQGENNHPLEVVVEPSPHENNSRTQIAKPMNEVDRQAPTAKGPSSLGQIGSFQNHKLDFGVAKSKLEKQRLAAESRRPSNSRWRKSKGKEREPRDVHITHPQNSGTQGVTEQGPAEMEMASQEDARGDSAPNTKEQVLSMHIQVESDASLDLSISEPARGRSELVKSQSQPHAKPPPSLKSDRAFDNTFAQPWVLMREVPYFTPQQQVRLMLIDKLHHGASTHLTLPNSILHRDYLTACTGPLFDELMRSRIIGRALIKAKFSLPEKELIYMLLTNTLDEQSKEKMPSFGIWLPTIWRKLTILFQRRKLRSEIKRMNWTCVSHRVNKPSRCHGES
jgi:rhodanese-related sulfurtransferase